MVLGREIAPGTFLIDSKEYRLPVKGETDVEEMWRERFRQAEEFSREFFRKRNQEAWRQFGKQ